MARDSEQYSSSPASSATPLQSSEESDMDMLPGASPFPYFSRFLHEVQPAGARDWISDLELMNHYTAMACRTLAKSERALLTLQYDAPREGLSHPFLLKQILAFAAFHLAYLHPTYRRKYQILASQHQDAALQGIRSTLASTLTPQNCHALYASSLLLIVSAFATYPNFEVQSLSFEPLDSLIDIFVLISGMTTVLNASRSDLAVGPLRALFGDPLSPSTTPHDLQGVVDRLSKLCSWVDQNLPDLDEEVANIIAEAATSLADSISAVQGTDSALAAPGLRVVFLWPIRLSSRYLGLLRQREPVSMAVLAHYCVLLHFSKVNYWFLEGWGKVVIDYISESLRGSFHEQTIRWPVDVITHPASTSGTDL